VGPIQTVLWEIALLEIVVGHEDIAAAAQLVRYPQPVPVWDPGPAYRQRQMPDAILVSPATAHIVLPYGK
jgi:hypothetical protein